MKILILQHIECETPGYIKDLMINDGFELTTVELDTGEKVTAHCANTGPMKGVLVSGGLVRVRYCPSSSRKLDWSWEQSLVEGERGSP